MKKVVYWLPKTNLTEKFCQLIMCRNLQVIKTRLTDVRSKMDLAAVLDQMRKIGSNLSEIDLQEMTFDD